MRFAKAGELVKCDAEPNLLLVEIALIRSSHALIALQLPYGSADDQHNIYDHLCQQRHLLAAIHFSSSRSGKEAVITIVEPSVNGAA